MAIAVEMPKMSDTMEEGVLVSWNAEEGDSVSSGDVIAQVETDKATMDLEVYDDGVLLKQVIPAGSSVAIGGLIAVLGKEGEDISEILGKYGVDGGAKKAAPAKEEKEQEEGEAGDSKEAAAPRKEDADREVSGEGAPVEEQESEGRVKSSPLARRLAGEYGIDLATVRGSGPEGRIVKRDIEALAGDRVKAEAPAKVREDRPAAPAKAPAAVPAPAGDGYESVRISQMRKTIARRLAESKFTAPHFYLTVEVDMEKALAFRAQVNALAEEQGRVKISVNDLITKACALALRQHPDVNSSYLEQEGEIRRHNGAHVAVAVAIDEGLVTPVIRDADQKGLARIAEETRSLAERARDRKLEPSDWEGSTFTTSNLGMFGIEEFTAIINPPNACILAIGATRDVPVVKDGQIVPGKRMKMTLSSDHRIVDGATGAAFLKTVQNFLEEPLNMLL
jgi:pyruvate dehydrogenase E2 component (dihydrolipoamide acetyltransferase)